MLDLLINARYIPTGLHVVLLVLIISIASPFLLAFYRVFLHPLARYPGPKSFAATNLIHIWLVLRGEWVHRVLELHEKYGPVVRVGPNEISYVVSAAWDDIYKAQAGVEQLKKYMPSTPRSFEFGLFNHPDDVVHRQIRKKVSPVLSDRGVREREDVLKRNIALMVKQLAKLNSEKSVVDIVGWFQSVTTDIVGCFLTGEDFGTLESGTPHPMMEANYKSLKGLAIGTAFNMNILTRTFIVKMLPPPQMAPRDIIAKLRYDRYLQRGIFSEKNLMTSLTENMGTDKGLPVPVAFRSFSDFILAGTDTVAITLAGIMYLLLRNPNKYNRLQFEIHSTFHTSDSINLGSVNALEYHNAVIMEGLRLWPPGPETTRRVVNRGGQIINGAFVPEGTLVGVYHWVAGRYSHAWKDADSFQPERWLNTENNEFQNDDRGVMNPYNIGPRNCVGQSLANAELRMILASLIWNFDISLEDPEDSTWMQTKIFGLVAEKRPLPVRLRYIGRS